MSKQRHAQQGLPDIALHDPAHAIARGAVVKRTRIVTLAIVLLLALGLARALVSHWHAGQILSARAQENSVLHVHTVKPKGDLSDARLTLPGTLLGTLETQIYARTNGYVKEWKKDIGAPVKAGEVLAILDIPEVNRQVDEAAANYALAKTAYERWSQLRADDAVSQQELDEKTGAYRQSEAVLHRLREQQSFGRVLAPFDGIISRRNVNVGDLVNAGNGGSAQALFAMVHTDHLHVYAYVPQNLAHQIRIGSPVELTEPSAPDRVIHAKVARTAGTIDLSNHTLQVDIDVPNPDHALLPGAYVDIRLGKIGSGTLALPTNCLLFSAAGTEVAVVRDNKAVRQSVALGTDYGRFVEVRSGIAVDDEVIVNPPDAIASGQTVIIERPAAAAEAPKQPAK